MARYAKPRTVDEALALLSEGRWTPLAGGTDFYPALGSRPVAADVLDLSGLDALKRMSETETHWVLGAGTTWSALARAVLPPAFDALKAAASQIGSVQIQNRATLGGNLCNASPAADGVPALLILDAEAELRSARGTRTLPLGEFILGNRRTARAPDELLTAIRLPKAAAQGASAFHKLGARRYLVISIAMAAVRLDLSPDRTVRSAAVAVGACSPVARRLPELEKALAGLPAGDGLAETVSPEHFAALAPIDDVRGSAAYRAKAAVEIVRRALGRLAAVPALDRAA